MSGGRTMPGINRNVQLPPECTSSRLFAMPVMSGYSLPLAASYATRGADVPRQRHLCYARCFDIISHVVAADLLSIFLLSILFTTACG